MKTGQKRGWVPFMHTTYIYQNVTTSVVTNSSPQECIQLMCFKMMILQSKIIENELVNGFSHAPNPIHKSCIIMM